MTDPTSGQWIEDVATGKSITAAIGSFLAGGPAGLAAYGALGVGYALKDILGVSAMRGERPMDERDTIFKGANFRTHNYDWTLVPKTSAEAKVIAKIATCFQTLAYPSKNVQSAQFYSRVIHPPIWHIASVDLTGTPDKNDRETKAGKGGTGRTKQRWTMYPLPSVLSSVSIKSRGAENGPWMIGGRTDAWPAATRISLQFTELEPAINVGKHLAPRSLLRAQLNSSGGYWQMGNM